MNKGILIIASGNPYWGKMAYNLCVSVKIRADIPVCVAYSGSALTHLFEDQLDLFDKRIEIDPKLLTGDPYFIKLNLDKITPYQYTIFCDADTIWLRNPIEVFNKFEDIAIQFKVRGEVDCLGKTTSQWISPQEIKEKYGYEKIYDLSSEFIYFEKSKCKEVFKVAREYYKESKVGVKSFGSGKPDEAFFTLALAKLGIKQEVYSPTFWQHEHKRFYNDKEMLAYPMLSMGGAWMQKKITEFYVRCVKSYHNHLGITRPVYQPPNKNLLFAERKSI